MQTIKGEGISVTPYQVLVDNQIRGYVNSIEVPNVVDFAFRDFFNPVAVDFYSLVDIVAQVPIWYLPFDKKPSVPEKGRMFQVDVKPKKLLEHPPKSCKKVRLEREMIKDRFGRDAVVERMVAIDKSGKEGLVQVMALTTTDVFSGVELTEGYHYMISYLTKACKFNYFGGASKNRPPMLDLLTSKQLILDSIQI